MTTPGDPVATGLVASLARPGGNVTGLTMFLPELAGKHLQLLKEAVPGLSSVALLWNPQNPGNATGVKEARAAASAMGLKLHPFELRDADFDFDSLFLTMTQQRVQALLVLADAITYRHRARIAALAAKRQLPSMWESKGFWTRAG